MFVIKLAIFIYVLASMLWWGIEINRLREQSEEGKQSQPGWLSPTDFAESVLAAVVWFYRIPEVIWLHRVGWNPWLHSRLFGKLNFGTKEQAGFRRGSEVVIRNIKFGRRMSYASQSSPSTGAHRGHI